ncbi:hypothetical protein ASPACDRAFT_44626 [Aspergillus aculeatus ATCC 16872]|uniref:Uncharacterized protein n=1 Tax=Aspergillus aculeatus (strain ATCC 16872 / CBS 172.66 / WB 5094) TaxID=690307 RepID=A0A1L9WS42_ASPA1|nr:uncharacterized protein ASPACDRAFT_44626 [Aspergillus aculeatus ATCC 16872]OJJ98996.1 hypothetical protein ASPACDRAFT_44626 [Aspergillus aculeatus ATCC 16872]
MNPSRLTSRENKLPACTASVWAGLDKGGGVRLGSHTFAIYSCAPLPPSLQQLQDDATTYTQLTTCATRVCETLPVLLNLEPCTLAQLASLPVSTSPSIGTIPTVPWFLLHASMFERHCVIGRGSAVESLLIILQRPWCVLEACCSNTETIKALRDFALTAAQVDSGRYDTAVRLLSHEAGARGPPGKDVVLRTKHVCLPPSSLAAVRSIYVASTLNAVTSYNRFWLSLICTCAVYLKIPFSELVRQVRDDLCGQPAGNALNHRISLYSMLVRQIGNQVM